MDGAVSAPVNDGERVWIAGGNVAFDDWLAEIIALVESKESTLVEWREQRKDRDFG